MNMKDLVRFTPRISVRNARRFSSGTLFYEKLIGPVRHAVLLARQLLVAEQRRDGSWGSVSRSARGGLGNRSRLVDTLLVMRSLDASGVSMNHRAILDGTKWLLRSRHCSSHLSIVELAAAIRLLATAQVPKTHCEQALPPELGVVYRSAPVKRQNAGGRVADYCRPLTASLVKQLQARQEDSGRWQSVALTGIALDAIASADADFTRDAIQRAVEFLDSRQHTDGSWGGTSTNRIMTTASALRGLCAAGVADDDALVSDGRNWLADQQCVNGGWGNDDAGCPVVAAWALLAFVAAGKCDDAAALSAVNYLVKEQDRWGGWSQSDFSYSPGIVGDCPDSDLQSIAWPLLALSRWAVAAGSAQSETTNRFTLRLFATPEEN